MSIKMLADEIKTLLAEHGVLLEDDLPEEDEESVLGQTQRILEAFFQDALSEAPQTPPNFLLAAAKEAQLLNE